MSDLPRGEMSSDDQREFGIGIETTKKERAWQQRASFWREKAIAFGYRSDAELEDVDVILDAACKAFFKHREFLHVNKRDDDISQCVRAALFSLVNKGLIAIRGLSHED